MNLAGRCGAKAATVLVATDAKGFIRESSTSLARPATESDIEMSLKAPRKKTASAND